jgi:hypothetical protein
MKGINILMENVIFKDFSYNYDRINNSSVAKERQQEKKKSLL